jgi:hypothetical protein
MAYQTLSHALDFYLQLFSFSQGIDASFLAWTVCGDVQFPFPRNLRMICQIPILNAGAMPGRVMPNFLADRYGTLNGERLHIYYV